MLKKLNKYVKDNPFISALFTTAFSGFAIYGISLINNLNIEKSPSNSLTSLVDNSIGVNIEANEINLVEKNQSYVDLKIIDVRANENSVDIFLKNSGTDSAYITSINCNLEYSHIPSQSINSCYSTYPTNYEIDVNLVKSTASSTNDAAKTDYIALPTTTLESPSLSDSENVDLINYSNSFQNNMHAGVVISEEKNHQFNERRSLNSLSAGVHVSQVVPPKGTDWINVKFIAKGGCNLKYSSYCQLVYDETKILHTGVFSIHPNSR